MTIGGSSAGTVVVDLGMEPGVITRIGVRLHQGRGQDRNVSKGQSQESYNQFHVHDPKDKVGARSEIEMSKIVAKSLVPAKLVETESDFYLASFRVSVGTGSLSAAVTVDHGI